MLAKKFFGNSKMSILPQCNKHIFFPKMQMVDKEPLQVGEMGNFFFIISIFSLVFKTKKVDIMYFQEILVTISHFKTV